MAKKRRKDVKVLHIITRLIRGGAEHNTMLSVKGLQQLEYNVSLAGGPSDKEEGDIEDDIRQSVDEVKLFHNLVREVNPLNDLMAFLRLYLYIKRKRFDIVHTHVSKAGILGRWAAKLAGVPVIVHTTHGHYFHGYFNPLSTRFFILLERLTALITDKMITLTHVEQEQYMEQGIGRPDLYVAILSGIDLNRFNRGNVKTCPREMRRSIGFDEKDLIIGTVGRIAPIKDHENLIRAVPEVVSAIPDARFVIVGDGPIRAEMEELAIRLGLGDRLLFIGMRKDIPELLSIMDIFVLPSLNEGMGRAMVEAMAMGVPVIASKVGGVPEVITDGETGLLVPPGNSKVLAEAIIRLASDRDLAKKLTKAGCQRAHEAFGADIMVDRISCLYQELLEYKHVRNIKSYSTHIR